MKITWLEYLRPKEIAINVKNASLFERKNPVLLHFGAFSKKMKLVSSNDFPEGTIGLPEKLSRSFTFPRDIPYECYIKEGQIYVGPIIAYLSMGKFEELDEKVFYLTLPDFLDYGEIKGLIYICTKDSIQLESGFIEGYYLAPDQKSWKYGKFPLPDAIFNRSFISQRKITALKQEIGDRIFNSYWRNLNKWRLWKRLSKDEKIRKHLPHTMKFLGIRQLSECLSEGRELYLKPCNNSRGRGIMKLSICDQGYLVIDAKGKKDIFRDEESFSQFITNSLKTPYIIQEAITPSLAGRHMDFRLVLQRDEKRNWSCTAFIVRIALEGGIITNGGGRESSLDGIEALQKFYGLSFQESESLKRDIVDIVASAVSIYEQRGLHLGDLAADIIIDNNKHYWLLELQLNYALDARSKALPPELFKRVMTTPFKYAKALAEFNRR